MAKTQLTTQVVRSSYKSYRDQSLCLNDADTLQVVDILGGIDSMLDGFLCEEKLAHHMLTETQLQRLHQFFTTPKTPQICQTLTKVISLNRDEKCNDFPTHIFDTSCSYLHDIVGHKLATKLMNTMHCVWPHTIFVLFVSFWALFQIIASHPLIYLLYSIIGWSCFGLPYMLIWVLSVNKKGLQLIMKTFEFWVKIAHLILACILVSVNKFRWAHYKFEYIELQILVEIIVLFSSSFFILTVSMFDALYINHIVKAVLCTTGATVVTLMLFYFEYVVYSTGIKSMIYVSMQDNIGLSLFSLQQNALEIIALFSWKQALLTIAKRNTNKTILIRCSPEIEWKTNAGIEHMNSNSAMRSPTTAAHDGDHPSIASIDNSLDVEECVVATRCHVGAACAAEGYNDSLSLQPIFQI